MTHDSAAQVTQKSPVLVVERIKDTVPVAEALVSGGVIEKITSEVSDAIIGADIVVTTNSISR